MNDYTTAVYRAVLADPRFIMIERRRRRLSLTLCVFVVISALAYIGGTAFYPESALARWWAAPLGAELTITRALVMGIAQVVIYIGLVGYYVRRINGEFAEKTATVIRDAVIAVTPR